MRLSLSALVVLGLGCGRVDFGVISRAGSADTVDTCLALDASWTPRWSSLIEYEPFDGAGAIGDGAQVPAVVGDNGMAANANEDGMAYVGGKVGQAITFDGIDDYLLVNMPDIDTAQGDAVSIGFWMRWNGALYANNVGNWTDLIVFDSPEYHLSYVGYGDPNPAFGFNTGNGDLWGVAAAGLANTWVQVVAVFENGLSSTSVLYIDGQVQDSSQTLPGPADSNVSSTLTVGARPSYPAYYAGAVDELAVWNVALAPAEVATLYATQEACP